ncbi:hypothetical protein HID58_080176, partial [Brassica napus]
RWLLPRSLFPTHNSNRSHTPSPILGTRNVNTSGELMGVDMLLLDGHEFLPSSLIQAYVSVHRLNTF